MSIAKVQHIDCKIADDIHCFNKQQFESYEKDIQTYLSKDVPIKISHLKVAAKKATKYSRTLDLSKGIEYQRRVNAFKQPLHWGQLKLMLTEVEFLSKIMLEYKNIKSDTRKIYFIYAGAAPGHHIYFLQKMFPTVHFELYDPNKFVVKDNSMLKTHVQFFMDADAEYWKKRATDENLYLTFCTDIRTEPATCENIVRNMEMQKKWWQIMNPELSMFKFRLPWEEGETEYPTGEIYIQPFPGSTSTETRLIVKKDAVLTKYNNKTYEAACFLHNAVNRQMFYPCKLGNLDISRDGIDNCYDCVTFVNIVDGYIKATDSKKTIRAIIKDILSNITFGKHTILSQTVSYFEKTLDTFRRMCYSTCTNKKCSVCTAGITYENPLAKGFSKATLDNEYKYKKEFYSTGATDP